MTVTEHARRRFLGLDVGAGIKTVGEDRTSTMLDFPEPATHKQLHSWLGKTNYIRSFIKGGYPNLYAPPTGLFEQGQKI